MTEFPFESAPPAPPLQVAEWLNTDTPLALDQLRGQVVVLHAFQMLCPGCLSHGLPQTERLHRLFRNEGVKVIGLHTVFEHHEVMGPDALRVFLYEYRWSFPVGVDQAANRGRLPLTMSAYHFEGTPSLALIDRRGRLRMQHLGHVDDLLLGSIVGRLLAEPAPDVNESGVGR